MQSNNWLAVAKLSPKLQQHLELYPQYFRDEKWYVLHDKTSGKFLRFNTVAYNFIALLDGKTTIDQIWENQIKANDNVDLTQDDIILVLSQLFAVYALKADLPLDAHSYFEKYRKEEKAKFNQSFLNPLSLKFSLFNPSHVLDKMLPYAQPFLSKIGLWMWCLMVGIAIILGMVNIDQIQAAFTSDIVAPTNLLLMLVTFILIKTVHEFSHALMTKKWGGEVNEMGISFLIFSPIPYVDASAATGFRQKYKRVLVGAAGIITELFIAAISLFIWLSVEPGLIKDTAFNACLIASFSTLIFNGNPLLRFDGYHILQDVIEIPNLYTRSGKFLKYLMLKYVFWFKNVPPIYRAKGETKWFIGYGILAFCFRYFLLITISVFLIEQYFIIGVILSIWMVSNQVIKPIFAGIMFIAINPQLNGIRLKTITAPAITSCLIIAALAFVPVSNTTDAQGVVWVKEQAQVLAEADGFVKQVYVESGRKVDKGTLLLSLNSIELEHKIAILQAKLNELQVQYQNDLMQNRIKSRLISAELNSIQAELDYSLEQHKKLDIYSNVSGTFVAINSNDLLGQYFRQGDAIGFVISQEELIVKAVLEQEDIGLVRQSVTQVNARLVEQFDKVFSVAIIRETPTASARLPSQALGTLGGGEISVANQKNQGTTANNKVFHLELSLPKHIKVTGIGERVYLRFEHFNQPLFSQWWHDLRQLFLSQFAI